MLYDIDMSLGKRLRKARLKGGLTQRELAALLDVSAAAVSGWERDESEPEVKRLAAILKALKVPADWLIQGEGDPPEQDPVEALIGALNSAQRRHAMRYLKMLVLDSDEVA